VRHLALLAALLSAGQAFAASKVIAIPVDGMIHPITVEIVRHGIEEAERDHASAVLIRLNTPGGLLDATRTIEQLMLASPIPVITYVEPSGARAASAGFFILETGDVAAMAPGTNTGASSPVLLGQSMDQVEREKIENDTVAGLTAIVGKRGRNTQLAAEAVRKATAFTDKEALDDHLIDLIANNEPDLLRQLNGRAITRFDGAKQTLDLNSPEIVEYQKGIRETIVSAIADPNIGFILLVLGVLGIYVEFVSPGLIFPGILGAILALLGLSGLSMLPINWVGVALLALAVTLFVLEAKLASHGILGVGATVCMILGALLLVNGPPSMRIHLSTAIGVALPFALITMFLLSLVLKARRGKAITGEEGLLQEVGEARTPLAPRGKVFVHGEYWDAVASSPVEPGARVRVVGVDGLLLRVEPIAQ
jgi:membrane-bound serine protease (ClpP class)